ncbi:hypothetical protein C7C46_33065, partial [Streptomyces tateyamensis]
MKLSIFLSHLLGDTLVELISMDVGVKVEVLIQLMNRGSGFLIGVVDLQAITETFRTQPARSTTDIVLYPWSCNPHRRVSWPITRTFRTVVTPRPGADIMDEHRCRACQHIVRV